MTSPRDCLLDRVQRVDKGFFVRGKCIVAVLKEVLFLALSTWFRGLNQCVNILHELNGVIGHGSCYALRRGLPIG